MREVLIAAAAFALMTGIAVAQPGGGLDRLRAADANGDGAITKAEARAAREAAFRRLDADGDGFITQAEREAAREAAAKGRGMGRGDTNGDGKISRAEFLDAPYTAFERLDSNKNDVLDAAELEAARALMGRGRK